MCVMIWYYWLLDTIPGRQCMASCFFLLRQFEDVLIYLNSVKVSLPQSEAHSDMVLLWPVIHWVNGVTDDKWCFIVKYSYSGLWFSDDFLQRKYAHTFPAPFHTGIIKYFSLSRVTSIMTIPSTSTMLRLKQHLATSKKQKRYLHLHRLFLETIKLANDKCFGLIGLFLSVFSADSEWKDQEWLCLPQLAGTMLYV